MPVAVFGPSGRACATIAALLLARGLAKSCPTTLVRVAGRGDPALPSHPTIESGPVVIDLRARDVEEVRTLVRQRIRDAAGTSDARLVLDLPVALLDDAELRAGIALPILAVGPSQLDETAAVEACARAAAVPGIGGRIGPAPAWFLGCARGGGAPAARTFVDRMDEAVRTSTDETAGTIPAVLPPIGQVQEYWLLNGLPNDGCREMAVALATAVDRVRLHPTSASVPVEDDVLDRDDRLPEQCLRDLADDLDGLSEGREPCASALARAPVIEDWAYDTRPRRVITGTVSSGHPQVRAGRRIVTSELFASDGRSYARTLGRYYRLGSRRAD